MGDFMITSIKKLTGKISAFLLLQIVMIQNAFAQIGFAEPPATDMSRQFINQIFGSLLDNGNDRFGGAISAFNGAVLIVGGILVAYTILAGTLGTAHDGEMLGKKFSSVWLPIRTALGTALVLPVLPGGYCIMQGLVMWLVMQGVSLGNMVWSAYTVAIPNTQANIGYVTRQNIKSFVEDVYIAQVCTAASQKALTEQPNVFQVVGSYNYTHTSYQNRDGATVWRFGDQGGLVGNGDFCGTVTEPLPPTVRIQTANNALITSVANLETVYRTPDLTPIHTAHINSIRTIINQTRGIADGAVTGPAPTAADKVALENQLNAMVEAYINNLQAAVAGVLGSSSQANFLQASRDQGWFLAGTWMAQLIQAQNKINSAIDTIAERDININVIKGSSRDKAWEFAKRGYTLIEDQRKDVKPFLNSNNAGSEKKEGTEEKSSFSVGGVFAKMLTSFIIGIDLENLKTDTRHPLIIMNEIGNNILTTIGYATVASAGIALGVGFAGKLIDFVPVFIAVYGTLAFPLMGFIAVGGMLAYILPNMPMLIWFGIIIGWTVLVVEAILAAPLWAVMHLHPTGDDVTGKGSPGYMLVLSLILRPALIVFGLIAAIVFSELFGQLLNKIFFDVFSANNSNATLGFFAVIFGTALYATLMFHIIKNTFALMHKIPDQLLKWIGSSDNVLGSYANEVGEGTMGKNAAVMGTAMTYMGTQAIQGLGGMASNIQNMKKQNDQIDELKKSNAAKTDETFGTGASSIMSALEDRKPGQQALFSQQNEVQSSIATLSRGEQDGPNGESALAYKEKLAENLSNPNTSFSDAQKDAFSHAYDKKFGEGAHDAATKIATADLGGRSINSAEGKGIYNTSFQRATLAMGAISEQNGKNGASNYFKQIASSDEPKTTLQNIIGASNIAPVDQTPPEQPQQSTQMDMFDQNGNVTTEAGGSNNLKDAE